MERRLRIENLEVGLAEDEGSLRKRAAAALGIAPEQIASLEVLRRAIDARRKKVRWSYHVAVELAPGVRAKGAPPAGVRVVEHREEPPPPPARKVAPPERPVVVIGAGPGGLFAARRLVESGVKCVLIERGAPVRERVLDVARFWRDGTLDPESNPLFGEGGAGTFSDGKLYTRTRDERIREVWKALVEFGADPGILVDAHPHVGTNRLRSVIPRLREDLVARGVEVRFHTRVAEFRTERGRLTAVVLGDGTILPTDQVLLAIGHSARDTYRALADAGVALEPMPYALGVRIEHDQELVDRLQLGAAAGDKRIGAASYRLAHNLEQGRAAYSFCMCPGGVIVSSTHEPATVVTNGMSASGRPGRKANAGMVVTVRPEDYAASKEKPAGPFDAIEFQRRWEQAAYEAGGGGFIAPAQRASDFLRGRPTESDITSSYLPGIRPGDVSVCLPPFVTRALRASLRAFDKTMPGFAGDGGILVAVESRVSSPVRIPRDPVSGESTSLRGLYPIGEGAGYAGGITSAAVDGMRAAEAVLARLS